MRMMPPGFDLKFHLENLRSLSEIRTGKVLPFRRREKPREDNTSVRARTPICSTVPLGNRHLTVRGSGGAIMRALLIEEDDATAQIVELMPSRQSGFSDAVKRSPRNQD